MAELCYQKAHYAASLAAQVPGCRLYQGSGPVPWTWFNEFILQSPLPPRELGLRLRQHRIIGGLDVSGAVPNGTLFCVTETNSRQEIEALASALAEVHG